MADDFPAYTSEQMAESGKAIVRGSGYALGTESGSDVGVLLRAVARFLVGTQVAARHAYDQLLPKTSTAQTLSEDLDRLAIDYSKPATKARGIVIVSSLSQVPAGTTLEFPASAFADGVGRSYVTLTGHEYRSPVSGSDDYRDIVCGPGCTRERVRVQSPADFTFVRVGDVVYSLPVGVGASMTVVTAVYSDKSFSVWPPLPIPFTSGGTVRLRGQESFVWVESTEEGTAGNAGSAQLVDTDTSRVYWLVVATGGADEQERQPADIERVRAWVQDHEAWPPGGGNAQHWREIAMKCPTVALDDAVVYMGARGPTTVDIVAIGFSGRCAPSAYANARVDFAPGGGNGRVLSPSHIADLQAWCNRKAAYHDEVRVLAVSHDYHGQGAFSSETSAFFQNVGCVDLVVQPAFGYGNDVKVDWSSAGHTLTLGGFTRLYASSSMPAFKPGHRVWVRLMPYGGDGYLTVTFVAEIRAVSRNRDYVVVDDFSGFTRVVDSTRIVSNIEVAEWGAAGPLTQPVLDAVYDYYDKLGPGSFITPEYGSGYQVARGHAAARSFRSERVRRWPSEGYRLTSGVRTSSLLAAVQAVPGVISATMSGTVIGPAAIDYDPPPLKTAALSCARVKVL